MAFPPDWRLAKEGWYKEILPAVKKVGEVRIIVG